MSRDTSRRATELRRFIDEAFDYRHFAQMAFDSVWESRTDDERRNYINSLKKLHIAHYGKKVRREGTPNIEFAYQNERVAGEKAVVHSKLRWSDGEVEVDFKLRKDDENNWKIFNVVVDNISLLNTIGDSYTNVVEEKGWNTLIEKIKANPEQISS